MSGHRANFSPEKCFSATVSIPLRVTSAFDRWHSYPHAPQKISVHFKALIIFSVSKYHIPKTGPAVSFHWSPSFPMTYSKIPYCSWDTNQCFVYFEPFVGRIHRRGTEKISTTVGVNCNPALFYARLNCSYSHHSLIYLFCKGNRCLVASIISYILDIAKYVFSDSAVLYHKHASNYAC
jgi:hypothetical protein